MAKPYENKKEIKIALVLDDYKLKNKDYWWRRSLDRSPEIEKDYDLVREEIGPTISKNLTTIYRFYRLKGR